MDEFDITFILKFGDIDGKYMTCKCQGINILPVNHIAEVTIPVKIPTSIVFEFADKDPMHGTKVDDEGNIIADTFVQFTTIKFDRMKVPNWALDKKITLTTVTGNKVIGSYIGFNGTVTLDLKEKDIFSQFQVFNIDN